MRFVVLGAGAIGAAVGGRLFQAGFDVTLVARGEHGKALVSGGLVLESPGETVTLPVSAVVDPGEVSWDGDADGEVVVLLAVKGQQTDHALAQLAVAPPSTPVVCMQNGVENERRVLRHFAHTYGICVMCPATQLRPGVVQIHSAPVSGLLDLGRFPSGIGEHGQAIADAIATTPFESVARPDIMRWKYRKLLMNLANAVEALSGPEGRFGPLARRGAARGQGGARGGRHRRDQRGGGPGATGRRPAVVGDGLGGVAGRVELAEPRPGRRFHRGGVPQR